MNRRDALKSALVGLGISQLEVAEIGAADTVLIASFLPSDPGDPLLCISTSEDRKRIREEIQKEIREQLAGTAAADVPIVVLRAGMKLEVLRLTDKGDVA